MGMDVATYLGRIGYRGPALPSLENLKELHRSHVLSVPFGSLAIHCGESIDLGLPSLYRKIVAQRREGLCYENNGLFAWLLAELGYRVAHLAGRVRNAFTQRFGPPKDHLVLLVELEGRRWLCDVGFGSSFRTPLLLEAGRQQARDNGVFRLGEEAGTWSLAVGEHSEAACEQWTTLYTFTLDRQRLEDFAPMCEHHQTSPSSIFYCKSFCSLQLAGGQLTYMGRRLITTEFAAGGPRRTTAQLEESQIPAVLRERFGITLTNTLVPKDQDILTLPLVD